jgi:nitric oxide reductase subunit B
MLGIGLMLFCLRALRPTEVWREGPVRFAFWAINGGLFAMVTFSLLPVGLLQTWASVEHGYWYARSAEFMQSGTMSALRWTRVLGDTLFAAGIVSLVLFIARLATGGSIQRGQGWSPSTGGVPPAEGAGHTANAE